MALFTPLSMDLLQFTTTPTPPRIFVSTARFGAIEQTQLGILTSLRSNPCFKLKASKDCSGLAQELKSDKLEMISETNSESDLFEDMKHRFLKFKKNVYMENLDQFENLANGQAPKFMVIACGDSRVCPSNILGFQPGEAFTVRNIANMVPTYESGPSETSAALEFAVNSVNVENILVIGHSRCGGIRALMSMQDEADSSSFIGRWVVTGKNARLSTKAAASNLSFDQQCTHCEKESVNCSLSNLLTYPWIKDRVAKGILSIHGGYYDFVDCTFEKWALDYEQTTNSAEGSKKISVKNQSLWR
jgi:carbonic anhydrase